jgi:hypothetical protein
MNQLEIDYFETDSHDKNLGFKPFLCERFGAKGGGGDEF